MSMKPNIMFVHTHLSHGGIETLIVRMSNWLVSNGHDVSVVLKHGGPLLDLLDEGVTRVILGRKWDLCFIPVFGKYYLGKLDTDNIDILYSFAPYENFFTSLIYRYGFESHKPRYLVGLYNPMDFAPGGEVGPRDKLYIELYNNFLDDRSKVFMSSTVKESCEKVIKKTITSNKILPLSVDVNRFAKVVRSVEPCKIVSIGRFVEWKTYNMYMIDVVSELVEQDFDVHWDVYGEGPLEASMKRKIESENLEEHISLKGLLPYQDIEQVLAKAHLFIGMGTAMIEAASCRVPCVTSIAYNSEALSYGPIYKLPYFATGEELSPDIVPVPIIDAIKDVLRMSPSEYEEECEKTFRYVQPYSLDEVMNLFLTMTEDVPETQTVARFPILKYLQFYLILSRVQISQFIRKCLGLRWAEVK